MTIPFAPRVLLLLIALLGAGCQAVPTEIHVLERDVDYTSLETFAFASPQAPSRLVGQRLNDPALLDEARQAVGANLRRHGLREVERTQADVYVTLQLGVEQHQRVTDPYFEVYAVQDYEVGILALELVDPRSLRTLWLGTARSTLRLLGEHVGLREDDFRAYDAGREWRLADKARALADDLPHASH